MTAEQYVALAVSAIGTAGVVLAAILPSQIKTWREQSKTRLENRNDHARVVTSVETLDGTVRTLAGTVDTLGRQVDTLTGLVVESVSELKAHTKWEESQKYATAEHVAMLVDAISNNTPTEEEEPS